MSTILNLPYFHNHRSKFALLVVFVFFVVVVAVVAEIFQRLIDLRRELLYMKTSFSNEWILFDGMISVPFR